MAADACGAGVDQEPIASEYRLAQRDVIRREWTVADLHSGELRLGELRFGVQHSEQRTGAVLRHAAYDGHDHAARLLLELQRVRVALVQHGLRALEELDQPLAL